ncbi:MAG: ATP-binding protein [Anaerolineales bacterium]
MTPLSQDSALDANLTELRASTVSRLATVLAAIGYLWLICLGVLSAPAIAWIGALTLAAIPLVAWAISRRYLNLASWLLVLASLASATMAILSWGRWELASLLVLPVIFSSVLLGVGSTLLVVTPCCVLTVFLLAGQLSFAVQSATVLVPMGMIVIVAILAVQSARNLYTALDWVWSGYQQAYHNELTAREGQAELRRTLKALDESTYRLERTNYMLALARSQADEARRLKQQFSQTISHELRTPLNLIVSFTELMMESPEHYKVPLPPAYARDLAVVHRNARQLESLINDVLDLARIEAAQMALVPEEAAPATLVRDAANAIRSLIEARGLSFQVSIEPDLPNLWLDPGRIRQVLYNLLINAARFTERGGITVSVQRVDREIIFAVADTGIGIAPENLSRVFEEFRQADGGTRRSHGGAGLGLAISKRFVELHGGRIWVESEPGQGSVFSFALPIESPDLSPSSAVGVPGALGAGAAIEEPVLLAVTPSHTAASLLTRYMRGCRTVLAQDIERGRLVAKQQVPQVVLVDAAQQPVTPDDLTSLAHSWGLPNVPFLACHLPGEEPLRQRLAVDGFLIKPVSRSRLQDVMLQLGADIDRVLVVDDDRDFARLMERFLREPLRQYQVATAYSGEEALQMVEQVHPDVVLLDLALPDMSGTEVAARLRGNGGRNAPKIVIVSAQEEIDNMEALPGVMLSVTAGGVSPGLIVDWVQHVVDTVRLGPSVSRREDAGSAA